MIFIYLEQDQMHGKRDEPTGHGPSRGVPAIPWAVIQVYSEFQSACLKWGFNEQGQPINNCWDEDAQARARSAFDEVKVRLRQVGLPVPDWNLDQHALDPFEASEWASAWAHEYAYQEEGPGYGLRQVAGMAALKELLMHDVIGPIRNPELYRRYKVPLPNGILFFGPPGCGKTYVARSLAKELGWHFQECRPSDVASPYIHDTVSKVRDVFVSAIQHAPSVVFIDEFEAFVPARSELGGHQQYKAEEVNEFLANLEGCAVRNVLVIAATNEPEKIDPAVRRSGRFDKLIYIPPPDAEARRAMLDLHLAGRPVEADIDTAAIAAVLEGYAASDIKLLVDEAARIALRQTAPISTETLLGALDRVPASITEADVERYSAL